MASIFTRIINGEIPSYKVAEDENFLAFLDINPLEKGIRWSSPRKRSIIFSTWTTKPCKG